MTEPSAVERVKSLLPQLTLSRVNYIHLSVDRLRDFDTDANPPTELAIEIAIGTNQEVLPFRFTAEASRSDIKICVQVEVVYTPADPVPWVDHELRVTLARKVALMAAYPYIRAKVAELAVAVQAPPPLLDILVQTDD